jgi:predicted CxxxxCH...CXXCH cytochrome family protein
MVTVNTATAIACHSDGVRSRFGGIWGR